MLVSDKKRFHSQSEYIISWTFLFINLWDKLIFFVFIVLMKTLEYRNVFFDYYFPLV